MRVGLGTPALQKACALIAVTISLFQSLHARTVYVSSGRDIALGFADPTVDTVIVTTDVAWTDADWSGIDLPVVLERRNFTVAGLPFPSGLYPTFDSNYVSSKVRLANSSLTFRNFVILHSRRVNQNLAPGCDMLTPCLPGDWGAVLLESSFLVQRLCYPASMHPQALAGAIRPRSIPGNQTYRPFLPQPGCVNVSAAAGRSAGSAADSVPPVPPQQRCWVHMGAYDDLGMFCADLDANQKQVPTGYTLLCRQVTYVCDDMISLECVQRLGTVGCYNAWGTLPSPPPSPPSPLAPETASPAVAATGTGSNDSARSSGMLAGALAGSLAGGAAFLVTAAAAVWWARRQRHARAGRYNGGGYGEVKVTRDESPRSAQDRSGDRRRPAARPEDGCRQSLAAAGDAGARDAAPPCASAADVMLQAGTSEIFIDSGVWPSFYLRSAHRSGIWGYHVPGPLDPSSASAFLDCRFLSVAPFLSARSRGGWWPTPVHG